MQIIFTLHAKVRQKQRKITVKQIIETIKKPDILSIDNEDKFLAFKKYNHLALKVIYIKEENKIKIISFHWLNVERLKNIKPVLEGEKCK